MNRDTDALRGELQAAGRSMIEMELAWGNSGNISARSSADSFLITATGTRLGELSLDDFAECPLEGAFAGERKPSKEVPMHRAIYQTRPEINVVLHSSPFYSTMIACTDLNIPSGWFIEAMYYLERVARVRYQHPGTEALGEAVRDKASTSNILLLQNHGVLVYDTSMNEAMMALQTLEFTCRMLIAARGAQLDLQSIPVETVSDFLNSARYKPRRTWLP
ncbi:MAG: class II aldolase/adducin family protein [Anaerolineae bacterium]|nr:class II aldolase/adducin family protein [Anaerolineae bacterium]